MGQIVLQYYSCKQRWWSWWWSRNESFKSLVGKTLRRILVVGGGANDFMKKGCRVSTLLPRLSRDLSHLHQRTRQNGIIVHFSSVTWPQKFHHCIIATDPFVSCCAANETCTNSLVSNFHYFYDFPISCIEHLSSSS